MNPDNYNMSEQELNAQRRRRAENFKLNIDESEYEDDNFVKSEDEPSNLNSYSGQDVKKQMARESKQVLKQKKKEEKKALKAKNKYTPIRGGGWRYVQRSGRADRRQGMRDREDGGG